MRKYVVLSVCCALFFVAPLYGEPLGVAPQVKEYGEAISLSYLQRAYFSLEQALFYTEKSRSTKYLASFDYARLLNDLQVIKKDLDAYLYPRREELTGGHTPFKIEGDYFLDDVINAK